MESLPFPFLGDLPDPGIESASLASPALAGTFFTTEPPGKPSINPRAQFFLPFSHFGLQLNTSIQPLYYTVTLLQL